MKNEEARNQFKQEQLKAQAFFSLLKEQPKALGFVLLSLSADYSDDPVVSLVDWVESYRDHGNLFDLISIVQGSKGFNLGDKFVRPSIYYYGYRTSDSVLDLLDEEEAVDLITAAIDDEPERISELIKEYDRQL